MFYSKYPRFLYIFELWMSMFSWFIIVFPFIIRMNVYSILHVSFTMHFDMQEFRLELSGIDFYTFLHSLCNSLEY